MENMQKLKHHDIDAYTERVRNGPCFICEMLAGKNPHHIVYQDDFAVAFMNKYTRLYGYVLVSPIRHREHVTSDFTKDEYLRIQSLIYDISEAIKKVVSTERMYILSLGSKQGNAHVHWHIAPLPPGVPYEKQQTKAISTREGILDISENEMKALADQIRRAMEK